MVEIASSINPGNKIIRSLSMGSGVDIQELAQALAEAENQPRIDLVTKKKDATSASISAYGVFKSSISNVKASFDAMKDKDSLLGKNIDSSSESNIGVKLTSEKIAAAGSTDIKVHILAKAQLNEMNQNGGAAFTSLTQVLNGGTAFNFIIQGSPYNTGTQSTVLVSNPTPQGVIDAINDSGFFGTRAYALNKSSSGTAVSIIVEGKTGANNSFNISNLDANSGNSINSGGTWANKRISSADLKLSVNGQDFVYREKNTVTDLVVGAELDFKKVDASNTFKVNVSENISSFRDKVDLFIEEYNTLKEVADYLTGEKNDEDELAGSLASDKSAVNFVLARARSIIDMNSSTSTANFSNLRQLGLGMKFGGELELNDKIFTSATTSSFSDIRKMLTADTNDQSIYSAASKGLALDASILLDGLINISGTITNRVSTANEALENYEDDLIVLQERLLASQKRYLTQFSAMESIVQRSKSTGDYLTQQFKAMQNNNNN